MTNTTLSFSITVSVNDGIVEAMAVEYPSGEDVDYFAARNFVSRMTQYGYDEIAARNRAIRRLRGLDPEQMGD
jgi:hypothetical protein